MSGSVFLSATARSDFYFKSVSLYISGLPGEYYYLKTVENTLFSLAHKPIIHSLKPFVNSFLKYFSKNERFLAFLAFVFEHVKM